MPDTSFIALDVETANPDRSSVCQIGIIEFQNGQIANEYDWLVNPEVEFDPFHTHIHGIAPDHVKGKPTWPDIYQQVVNIISDQIVVCHTPFDRTSMNRLCDRYNLAHLPCNWLDTAEVARRTWAEFSGSGYALARVAYHLSISYQAHNAKEDARAAGEVLLRAIEQTKIPLSRWMRGVHRWMELPCNPGQEHPLDNHVGRLQGEVVVFTGTLTIPRGVAEEMAQDAGCEVGSSVTTKTTLLIVGAQDMDRLGGYAKSSKHRKAEELIIKGQQIRIIHEDDFMALVKE